MNGGSVRCARSLLLLVATACGSPGHGTVDVERIEPASATNVAPVPVQLDGAFALDITSDLDTGKHGVAAVEVMIDSTPLTDVVWTSDQRIDAVIPAGLDAGLHDIVVRIGAREGRLDDGFAITGASLTAALAIPTVIGRGTPFTVTMNVTNDGVGPASAVAPAPLVPSGVAASLVTDATGGVSLAAGASITFEWTYTADAIGTLAFTGNATALDDLTGMTINSAAVTSNMANVLEATTVLSDPLGDASTFAYVVGHGGKVYVGPNDKGAAVSRLAPDGTGLETNIGFTFTRDSAGNTHDNATSSPFTSIGYTGCTLDTTQCGPDNENGRGYFASGTLDGMDWLVLGGGRATDTLEYIYMTTDTDSVLDFRYVDLSPYLGANTHGFSAAHFLNGRLYLGFPDTGGAKPYFLSLDVAPPAPGLDASGQDVYNLGGDQFPGFNTTTPAMIDALGDLNGLLYVANAGGIYGATVMNPGAYVNGTTDWALSTPAFTQWSNKASYATTKTVDLLPADRAIVGFASFKGRLFFGRNTTSGPQLWACDPAKTGDTARCDRADWTHAAPNVVGDFALTQFNNTALTKISMVVATPAHLYVGFDSDNGVQVFRTADASALLPAAFEGLAGCPASSHPTSCQGIGGTGLGDATDTTILDARALTFGTQSAVWITVGNGTGATRLVMIP